MNVWGKIISDCDQIQMFNSLHLVHISALLQEESLLIGEKNANKINSCVAAIVSTTPFSPTYTNKKLI